jgi:hypothetical protein
MSWSIAAALDVNKFKIKIALIQNNNHFKFGHTCCAA